MTTSFSNPNAIILLGYMGSGKSTVGKLLALRKGVVFEDLDDVIAQAQGTSIPDLFVSHGAKSFRELEHNALKNCLADTSKKVISLGGGAPCYFDNMKLINATTSHVFYLKASPKILAQRLFPEKDGRPLIAHTSSESELREFVAKHLFERQNFYMDAHHTISVDHKSIEDVVEEIVNLL